MEGYVKTSALRHDAAWLSLTFKDAARAKLADAGSEKIDGTTSWRKVCVGPVTSPLGASTLFVGVHLVPKAEEQDLTGTAWFGSLWVGRLPRVVLTARAIETAGSQAAAASSDATRPASGFPATAGGRRDILFPVFARDPQTGTRPVEVACLVSGFAAPKYDVRLELQDVGGRTIARHEELFSTAQPRAAATKPKSNSDGARHRGRIACRQLCPCNVEDSYRLGRILSRPRGGRSRGSRREG